MPADANINQAIAGALQATNGGFQPTTATPAIVSGDTAAIATKATRYTLLRDNNQAPPVYSYTTGEAAKPYGPVAQKHWQIGVQKTGTVNASTWLKPADYAGLDAIRGVLTIGAAAGDLADLKLGGLRATITPTDGAAPLDQLTVSVGGTPGVAMAVEAALTAVGLVWSRMNGCTAEEAMIPVGPDMPTVATAAAVVIDADTIAGANNFAAKAALAALGIATPASTNTLGGIASLIVEWAGMPVALGAVTAILAVTDETTERRKKAKESGDKIIDALRRALAGVSADQMALIGNQCAQLAALGLAVEGAHIGQCLHNLQAAVAPVAAAVAPPQAAAASAGGVAPSAAALAEAANQMAPGFAAMGAVDPATKAQLTMALAHKLTAEGFGAAASRGSTAGLEVLRINGASRLSGADIIAEIAKAKGGGCTPKQLTDALAEARGAVAPLTLFAPNEARAAERAAEDVEFMLGKANISFEAQPSSWAEAGERLDEVVGDFQRVRGGAGSGASTEAHAPQRRQVTIAGDDEAERTKIFASTAKNGERNQAAAGAMLNPLTADAFCKREALAAKEHSTLAEVRRLCGHLGDEGRACEAHHLSDGKFSGAMAGKGIIAASVVASREALVQYVEDEIEVFLGDTLAGQAGQGLNDLAIGIVTASIKTTEVIKLLGAHSSARSTMAGRTIWGASRFGATSGARHRHARAHTAALGARAHAHAPHPKYAHSGSHRRLCGRTEGSGRDAHEA